MKTNVKINTKPLENYFERLSTRWGKQQMPLIVQGETVKILMTCVKKQKSAKIKTLTRSGLLRGYNRSSGSGDEFISINTGKKKGRKDLVWYSYKNNEGKRVYKPVGKWNENTTLPAHNLKAGNLSNDRLDNYKTKWAELSSIAKIESNKARNSRGSTAKSWYEIITRITKTPPKIASYIIKAKRRDGKSGLGNASMGFSRKNQYNITATNSSGLAIKTGGQKLVNFAISSRRAFWNRAFKNGWDKNTKFVSSNAPFIKLS